MTTDSKTAKGAPGGNGPRFPWHILAGAALGLVVTGVAALVVLGSLDRAPNGGTTTADGAQDPTTPAAPNITFQVYDGAGLVPGETKKLSDFRGMPVVLNFWAGLCPPCRAEMPHFQEVAQQYGGQVVVLGLDVGPYVGLGASEDGRKLLQGLNITYPTGLALDSDEVVRYQLVGMPTTYFLDAKGNVKKRWAGFLPREELVSGIQSLLTPS